MRPTGETSKPLKIPLRCGRGMGFVTTSLRYASSLELFVDPSTTEAPLSETGVVTRRGASAEGVKGGETGVTGVGIGAGTSIVGTSSSESKCPQGQVELPATKRGRGALPLRYSTPHTPKASNVAADACLDNAHSFFRA